MKKMENASYFYAQNHAAIGTSAVASGHMNLSGVYKNELHGREKKETNCNYHAHALKAVARLQDKPFDEGDTFFALAFKTDAKL